jgi:hypothetical protein
VTAPPERFFRPLSRRKTAAFDVTTLLLRRRRDVPVLTRSLMSQPTRSQQVAAAERRSRQVDRNMPLTSGFGVVSTVPPVFTRRSEDGQISGTIPGTIAFHNSLLAVYFEGR